MYSLANISVVCCNLMISNKHEKINSWILARSKRGIWNLSDCSETRTHSHLFRKPTFKYLIILRFTCVRELPACTFWPKWNFSRTSSFRLTPNFGPTIKNYFKSWLTQLFDPSHIRTHATTDPRTHLTHEAL